MLTAVTLEIVLGRTVAIVVHPVLAWRRMSVRGRVALAAAYASLSYVAALTVLLELGR